MVDAMPASGIAALADELRRLASRPTRAEAEQQQLARLK